MCEIDFEFATRDDCLQKMVPSDLRAIISERDRLREENTELLHVIEYLRNTREDKVDQRFVDLVIAKGEQG